jgi:hypothetical protein
MWRNPLSRLRRTREGKVCETRNNDFQVHKNCPQVYSAYQTIESFVKNAVTQSLRYHEPFWQTSKMRIYECISDLP